MRNLSFTLKSGLFDPMPPFAYDFVRQRPWGWQVTDARGFGVALASTRAGARFAVRALYGAHPLPVVA